MKKLILILVNFLITHTLSAQMWNGRDTLYGNEWVSVGQSYFKLTVTSDGIYRLTGAALRAAGVPMNTVKGNQFRLYRLGQEVSVFTSVTDNFADNDFIEFYGQKHRAELDEFLHKKGAQDVFNPEYSLISDTIGYYLTWNNTPSIKRVSTQDNDLTNAPAKEAWYWQTDRWIYKDVSIKNGLSSNNDVFLCSFVNGEGFGTAMQKDHSFNLTLQNPITTEPAQLTMRWSGNLFPHITNISYDADTIIRDTNYNFSTGVLRTKVYDIPLNKITANFNLKFSGKFANLDLVSISNIAVKYARSFNFNNAPYYEFSIPASSNKKYVEIDNFKAGTSAPILWDITNNLRIVTTVESGKVKFVLPPSVEERKLVLYSVSEGINTIATVQKVTFPNFKTDDANYVFITSARFLNDNNQTIQGYANYRASAAGGGYKTKIVSIQDIYEQFGYGIPRHPAAVRNFIHFIKKNWRNPQYVLFVGKARHYRTIRTHDQLKNETDVDLPTWGSPGGDMLFATTHDNTVPTLAVGRIAAVTLEDFKNYFEKIKAHETAQNLAPQTIEKRDWLKNIIHLNGGGSLGDQINSYMRSFGSLLSSGKLGAQVTTFIKNSTEPIQPALSEKVYDRINAGSSLITFFGHSATNILDFDINNPLSLKNENKYPVFSAFGCSAGNVHLRTIGVSENLTFYKDKGVIAFFGTSGLSYLSSLGEIGNVLYDEIADDNYGRSFGEIIQATYKKFNNTSNVGVLSVLEEFTLNGDPALKLHTAKGPDYTIDATTVKFTPSVLTAQMDSFIVNFDIVNLGTIISDSMTIQVRQALANGQTVDLIKTKAKTPSYRSNLSLNIPMLKDGSVGSNRLLIKVNADNTITESPLPAANFNNDLTTNGTEQGIRFFVYDNNVSPVFPPMFSIINKTPITLKASTSNVLAAPQNYVFEIDTTEAFNSPLKQRNSLNQSGGIIKWQPNMPWRDSTVYYWRAAIDSTTPQGYVWANSSFVYLSKATEGGWNQSHFYQLDKNNFTTLELNSDNRKLEYKKISSIVEVRNNFGNLAIHPIVFYNNTAYATNQGFPDAGLYVMVFDSLTNNPWFNQAGNFIGMPHPRNFSMFNYVFNPNDSSSVIGRGGFINFIKKTVPKNNYVLVFTVQQNAASNFNPQNWAADSIAFGTNIFKILEEEGATQVRGLQFKGSLPYVLAFKKGSGKAIAEKLSNVWEDGAPETFKIEKPDIKGSVLSSAIGPSKSWQSIETNYSFSNNPSGDTVTFDVLGYNINLGDEKILLSHIKTNSTSIANIDAKTYPYIRLRFNTKDSLQRSSAQLNAWRVFYKKTPDFVVNPAIAYRFYTDTLQQGDTVRLDVGIENIADITSDSVLVKMSVVDESNNTRSQLSKYASLNSESALTARFNYNTINLSGKNNLIVEVNPDKAQLETYTFNNYLQKPFVVEGDKRNPLLDVTFDGVRIMNNDIVSPRPLISVQIKDENKYLLLNDTALFRLLLEYPNGQTKILSFKDPSVKFIPATGGDKNNRATIELNPVFTEDGTYHLAIAAKDASGNVAGTGIVKDRDKYDYSMAFKVITKSSLSNVLNYPNPFSTATRFVYTLTGTEPPQFFKIQIMTVAGKIVREITHNDIGSLKIGTHLTDYVWDGTDEFGDKLANGVYLYRIVAKKKDGSAFEKYENETDQFFKKDFGKLVIMR